MSTKKQTGDDGEAEAAAFLQSKGYEIVERNFRHKKSEIDIIAMKDNWLVFVEVKTRSYAYFGYPEEFVDAAKQKQIFYAADEYMHRINWEGNVRYDIVSVLGKGDNREVMHFEDAFY